MLVEEKIDSYNKEEQIANDRNFYKALREIKHKEKCKHVRKGNEPVFGAEALLDFLWYRIYLLNYIR